MRRFNDGGKENFSHNRPNKKHFNGDFKGRKVFNKHEVTSQEASEQIISDQKAQVMLKRMVRCNTLTISTHKPPEYYLKLIRYHFVQQAREPKVDPPMPGDDVLVLQALGLSCQNLVYVACLVTLKGYATYKRIKNDHLSVPVVDSRTGAHMGLLKKVRLTVKLQRVPNFLEVIEGEQQPSFSAASRRDKKDVSDDAFEKEDLVLKNRRELLEEQKQLLVEEVKHENEFREDFYAADPNFVIEEEQYGEDETS